MKGYAMIILQIYFLGGTYDKGYYTIIRGYQSWC